ncbi:MAG TPA: hypothetical protein PLK99_00065 [Burkholderiales bacterium]|nr:hypothetical protein [Burkholderiales bacterium]
MFTTPSTVNLPDFCAYALAQGVPAADIPSGGLTLVMVDTQGNLSAVSTSGTVLAGQLLYGPGIPDGTYIATWTGATGTVQPAPTATVSVSSAKTSSQWAAWALNMALMVALPGPGNGPGLVGMAGMHVLATYNLGLHQLLKIGQDQPGQTFFSTIRQTYRLGSLVPGPVMASGDQATSETLVVPDFFKTLTLSDLDLLKTPYGRDYLGYAQMYGPTIVGVS